LAGLEGSGGTTQMAITDTATHALLIDGEDVATASTPLPNDNEAFALAGDTRRGPAVSAWTRDVFRAQRAARELEAGTVWINEHLAIGSETPHGGVKGSGFGKDMSMYALEEHTAVEHVVFELTGEAREDWYDAVSPVPADEVGRVSR
jgi:betaine-aldehyde dehydrogenase